MWHKRLLKDLTESVNKWILIYCANLSNIELAKNIVCTKHIKVHYHFIREKIVAIDNDLQYININK